MKAIALGALFLALTGLSGQEGRADDKPFDDATFVATAASSGMHEVELAKLAMTQAKNDAVKKLAETLAADHGKANEELKKVATEGGLRFPTR